MPTVPQQPPSRDRPPPAGTSDSYTWFQRLLLYFDTTRRKAFAVVVVMMIWLLLEVLDLPAIGFGYVAIFVLGVLFTQGAWLRKPTELPQELMQSHADARYTRSEEWQSPLPVTDALAAVEQAFDEPGAHSRRVGDSVWIEFTGVWRPGRFRHGDVAKHLRINPSIHVFASARGAATRMVSHSHDGRLVGMWDVMQLSDEMADAAVRLAREVTDDGAGEQRSSALTER